MGIIRGLRASDLETILPAYVKSGLNTIEVTMNTPGATELIQQIRSFAGQDLQVGAGTVRSVEDLRTALDAGAAFIVTPTLEMDVIRECVTAGVPVFPGAFTPTEIHQAHRAGATMVKVFPAAVLGPDYIRNLRAPLPDIRLMPTGGIDLAAMRLYRKAGADAFGIGSPLFKSELIEQRDPELWLAHFRTFANEFSE